MLRKIIKKPAEGGSQNRIRAVMDAVERMKKETRQSILSNFNDYKENLKYQYFFKIIDASSRDMYETAVDRFQAYTADLTKVDQAIFDKGQESLRALELLDEMARKAANLEKRIDETQQKLTGYSGSRS